MLEPYAGKGPFDHQGQRIVVGQRLMQAASDIFLGWTTGMDGMHFYIRQLRDMKFSSRSSTCESKALANYAARLRLGAGARPRQRRRLRR